jgi:hypothetical protein
VHAVDSCSRFLQRRVFNQYVALLTREEFSLNACLPKLSKRYV